MHFGLFIYEDTEPIDLAPFGVLSMAQRIRPDIRVSTVAPTSGVIRLTNGLSVIADFSIGNAPAFDALIVAGGMGWVEQSKTEATLDFLRTRASDTLVMSVCTGALILAAAGLLDGRLATTKFRVLADETSPLQIMKERYPAILLTEASLVDSGAIITAGGVSLCIDATLYLIGRLYGIDVANETARIMEYDRAWEANRRLFPAEVSTNGKHLRQEMLKRATVTPFSVETVRSLAHEQGDQDDDRKRYAE